jgi:hypothetical protein
MPRVDVRRVLVQSGDQSSKTTQSGSKFVFKFFNTSGEKRGKLFFIIIKAERGGGAPKNYTREYLDQSGRPMQRKRRCLIIGAALRPGTQTNNMTPRGRRLGPDGLA